MNEIVRDANEPTEVKLPLVDPPTIDARELFGPRREVWIEFDGMRYRLRITRRNKLILQK